MGKYRPKRYPLNATVPLGLISEVDELAKARKQPFSRCCEDLLKRGLETIRRETEDLEFEADLQAVKDVEKARKTLFKRRSHDGST